MDASLAVTVDNFARAESDRMFASLVTLAGGVNRFGHIRTPTPIDAQSVVRMNRDTLYSAAVVDVTGGAQVRLPDAGSRYLSVMVLDEDHFVVDVLHDAGSHQLDAARFETDHALLVARILVDAQDPGDVAEVNVLQDLLGVTAPSARAFDPPSWDRESLDDLRAALLRLGAHLGDSHGTFGRRGEVDAVRHLVGVAIGYGGLPEFEAFYVTGEPTSGIDAGVLAVRDVPVDAFWSVSVYNAAGYFEANDEGVYSVNSVTARRDDDGSVRVHFGGPDDGRPNRIPIVEGWNYTVRLYRPRAEILDGTWTFPSVEPI